MHTATKVMLILGGVITVIGLVMYFGGAEAAEHDLENDSDFIGKSGSWDFDGGDWYIVYVKDNVDCDGFTASMTDSNGSSTNNWDGDNLDVMDCDYVDTAGDPEGFMSIGSINADDAGTYSMSSSSTMYISGVGEELGEAVGGFMAMLGGIGVICCGGFFLLLGGIFALTLKEGGDTVVVVNQAQQPMMMATGMAAPQYDQPVQYQAPVEQAPAQQEYQQPPQGGL